MKHDLLSFSFAMDDIDEIFLRVLDSTASFETVLHITNDLKTL